VIIVIGSMAGQWYAVQERFGLKTNFWFGHQGYEYTIWEGFGSYF
jgi:nitric oxide reductase subunit B